MGNQVGQQMRRSLFTIADTNASPAPLGLLGLGMTIIFFSLVNAEIFTPDPRIFGTVVFYGSLAQISVGIMELKKHHAFGAVAFTSLGLFWLSLIALAILPESGLSRAPGTSAMAAYLTMWGFFSAILFIGTFNMNRALQAVFGLLTLLFFLLAAGDATRIPGILTLAGYEGLACGAAAIHAGFTLLMSEIRGRAIAGPGK